MHDSVLTCRKLLHKYGLPVLVFVAYFLSAKLGQYIYYSAHTSPALLWPPAGIAIAATLLGGYRMWFPIALAAYLSSITGGSTLPVVFASTLGNTIQPLAGAYLMNKIGFSKTLQRTNDIVGLIIVAIFVTMIAPSILVVGESLSHAMTGPASLVWGRTWAGGILSVITFTAFICAWVSGQSSLLPRTRALEFASAFALALSVTYVLFWTPHATLFGFPIVFAQLIPFFWLGLRFGPRAMTTTILSSGILAIAGTMYMHLNTDIGAVLYNDELYYILIAATFLVLDVVVEERRSAARDLRLYIAELERAVEKISTEDRAKSEFIAILAHELRNPLSPIVSGIEIMRLREGDGEMKQPLTDMHDNARSMKRLLDDLLDIARITQRRFKIQREPIELRGTVMRALGTVDELMRKRHHQVEVSLPEEDVWIAVDPARFDQILLNLLNNAVKYTDPGGRIRITARREGAALTLHVADTGIGIAPEMRETIFEPFRQLRPGTAGGLGIGLSITKRLVEMHQGTIAVESGGPGHGSTFTITLPDAVHIQSNDSTMDHMTESSAAENGNGLRILIVDDNEPAARGLQKLLGYRGHTVSLAFNGEDALHAAAEQQPDVVVLDIGLPDMDGYEVARRLRTQGSRAVLIALTGYGQEEDKALAFEAGFDHHLTKPVGLADIEAVLP